MKRADVVKKILHQSLDKISHFHEKGIGFAPASIALCKYWGKRDLDLNLPITDSLSVGLPDRGAFTTLTFHDQPVDVITIHHEATPVSDEMEKRISQFLSLFRPIHAWHLNVDININVPVGGSISVSPFIFASLVLALNDLFQWQLNKKELSILARLGSGSASRAFWNGFVEWHAGVQPDGMDSFSEPCGDDWPGLCVGLLSVSQEKRSPSTREAMRRTANTSVLYGNWPKKVSQDMVMLKQAIHTKNFSLLGGTAESNALAMQGTLISAWPPICYWQPETIVLMQQIWELRKRGREIYFTLDTGPGLTLLLMENEIAEIKNAFQVVEIIKLFE